jgi:hypothetical protein
MSDHTPAAEGTLSEYDKNAQATTRRGVATISFCFGLWGLAVFWWYPYGMMLGFLAIAIGSVTLLMGVRAGKDGENLSWGGVILGSIVVGSAFAVHRLMQVIFEGSFPTIP